MRSLKSSLLRVMPCNRDLELTEMVRKVSALPLEFPVDVV
jgi:hypothetical protein